MSSSWPSALASLDDDLALLCQSLEKIEAARSVELDEIIEQLNALAQSSGNLRALVLSELPNATWQDRQELEAFLDEISKRIEARNIEERRSRLLALAAELEAGTITHRRAARVTQLNHLREDAIADLQMHSEEASPPTLPGPEPERWVDWACDLKEPQDSESLQALRNQFAALDEFIANIEPGMWNMGASSEAMAQPAEEVDPAAQAKEIEQRRSRLLALAGALERGSIVHHRAMRVTQVNQLRDQAIKELRRQAVLAGVPPNVPGPEADRWVDWACNLKEPEDAESLQILRKGFAHLDEFVANLEPEMWADAGRPVSEVVPPVAKPADQTQETPRVETKKVEEPVIVAATENPVSVPPPVAKVTPKTDGRPTFSQLTSRLRELSQGKSWLMLAIGAVLLLAVLGATQWRLHRTHASTGPVKTVDAKAPDPAVSNPGIMSTAVAAPAASAGTLPATDARTDKGAKPKDQSATAPKPPATDQPQKQVSVLNDAALRMPAAIPKGNGANATEETLPAATEGPGPIPGALPSGARNGVLDVASDVPVPEPKIATQKVRVSSGVAQGQLVHQVTPVYPNQARLAGIRGTVVLQAVIGKDGAVQSLHAIRGPSMLVQPALDAVKQWRYKPFAVNGEPAEADVQINVNFNP